VLNEQELNSHSLLQITHTEPSLNIQRNEEFSFESDRASQLGGELQSLELSNPQQQFRSFNKSNTKYHLLVPYDRYVFFYDELITRIDCQNN
jgi:hypothetical protein